MAQHHDHLSAQFSSTMTSLTHEWGFVVVRTAYVTNDAATDAAQWSKALAKLREYALPSGGGGRKNARRMHPRGPDTFALPVVADPTTLEGASYDQVRTAFNDWVDQQEEHESRASDVRRDCCLVIDGPALASLLLLQAPEREASEQQGRTASAPWVVAVDTRDPATIPYNGGGPYLGWTRVSARLVGDLFEDLEARSLAEVCPRRVYDGQLPLYDGFPGGSLIDPDGGVEGRYKFPQGTPRGLDGTKAMLADIERALGSQAVIQTAGVGGRVRQRSAA
ncbi:hypothetical protein C8A00DRAFT_36151 [Chaetomidium leptoderma]|uniref:Uncharacterized protein n=1 Tax=Chaetomidium leptoderma TaxID=669021 RepID=A0AAN6VI13_9PEZI|nr:hypothetical protein C8A00DRAFT_36151 [Chaetomidium leptoderma]